MNDFKAVGIKFLMLIGLLIGLNYLYKFTFYEKDLQEHSEIINLVREVVDNKAEIVYVGESSNNTAGKYDLDKRKISDFLADFFPGKKVGDLTKPAAHAGIFYELLRNIPEDAPVETIVMTMNLRSFDANWIFSNLETPLQKSIVLLKNYPPLYNRFLLSFKQYDIKTDLEREAQFKEKWKQDTLVFPFPFKYVNVVDWDSSRAIQGVYNMDGTYNQQMTELACHYIKAYAFQIDTLTNPRIKDFDKIVQLAKKRNWNLLFNLLAENTQQADSLVGKELIYLIRQNEKLLVNRYSKNNVYVVDNLDSVASRDFLDKNWTTEHYAENGRKKIALNVAHYLKKFYPDQFVEAPVNYFNKVEPPVISSNEETTEADQPSDKEKLIFYTDCETDTTWGQSQTLTTEKSFSGKKSSRTGQKQNFSITFESPVANIPDWGKKVNVSFQVFQSDITPDAKLVIDVSGKKITPTWQGVPIRQLSQTTDKWTEINYSYKLPPNFHEGDLIKIYIYNPTESIIYIDDLKLEFTK
ncbi:MAG TPA: DUF4843 domain-containing protein [Bacteroidia bacterium]|nr:DUF4843 domain-containing protein [Bacteroidia bacterium]